MIGQTLRPRNHLEVDQAPQIEQQARFLPVAPAAIKTSLKKSPPISPPAPPAPHKAAFSSAVEGSSEKRLSLQSEVTSLAVAERTRYDDDIRSVFSVLHSPPEDTGKLLPPPPPAIISRGANSRAPSNNATSTSGTP